MFVMCGVTTMMTVERVISAYMLVLRVEVDGLRDNFTYCEIRKRRLCGTFDKNMTHVRQVRRSHYCGLRHGHRVLDCTRKWRSVSL